MGKVFRQYSATPALQHVGSESFCKAMQEELKEEEMGWNQKMQKKCNVRTKPENNHQEANKKENHVN